MSSDSVDDTNMAPPPPKKARPANTLDFSLFKVKIDLDDDKRIDRDRVGSISPPTTKLYQCRLTDAGTDTIKAVAKVRKEIIYYSSSGNNRLN